MTLDKAIEHGKEKRKPYRKSKRFDRSCRNHGHCGWCRDDRLYRRKKEIEEVQDKELDGEDEYYNPPGEDDDREGEDQETNP